jgi:hypothetical protein
VEWFVAAWTPCTAVAGAVDFDDAVETKHVRVLAVRCLAAELHALRGHPAILSEKGVSDVGGPLVVGFVKFQWSAAIALLTPDDEEFLKTFPRALVPLEDDVIVQRADNRV